MSPNRAEDGLPELADCYGCQTTDAIIAFSRKRYAALARKVIYRFQCIPAIGIYADDYGHRTLWDEYCHEAQFGPTVEMEHAWWTTTSPYMDEVIGKLPAEEFALLAMGAMWIRSVGVDWSEGGADPQFVYKALDQEVGRIAAERDLSRFDPVYGGRIVRR